MKIELIDAPKVVMSNPMGIHNYFGWPSVARLQDGKIAEKGNHEELIKLPGGHYRSLCEAQYRFMTADE